MTQLFRIFDRALQTLLFLCIAGFVIIAFSQVVARFGLNHSIPWAEEACRYLFVWMVFVGSGMGILHRRHIMIDIVPNLIPKEGRKYYNAVIDLLLIAFTILLIRYGYAFAMRGMSQRSPAMQIPLGYIYSGIVLGAVIMFVNTIRVLCADLFAAPVVSAPEPAPTLEMTQSEFNQILGIETGDKEEKHA